LNFNNYFDFFECRGSKGREMRMRPCRCVGREASSSTSWADSGISYGGEGEAAKMTARRGVRRGEVRRARKTAGGVGVR